MSDPRLVSTSSFPDGGGGDGGGGGAHDGRAETHDPLRLCVFATVALLGWLLGPVALLVFAGLGFVGYAKARRRGLLTSRCLLGDTRLVLAYLAVLFAAGLGGLLYAVQGGWS